MITKKNVLMKSNSIENRENNQHSDWKEKLINGLK